MYFLGLNLSFLLIIFNYPPLILSDSSIRIDDCQTTESTIQVADGSTYNYNGTIDIELEWKITGKVALVKKATFSGERHLKKGIIVHLRAMDIASLKSVRVQHYVEYTKDGFKDVVIPQCSIAFIYDADIKLNIFKAYENAITSLAEKCIEERLCKFDPESHRSGDNIHVKSRHLWKPPHITSQKTINTAVDSFIDTLIDDLVKKNKNLVTIPEFDYSGYTLNFKTSGGAVDLKYVKRDGDISLQHAGTRYIIELSLKLTGGYIQLHDVSASGDLLLGTAKGELPINMTGANLRMKVALGDSRASCNVEVIDLVLNISPDQIDFSPIKLYSFGFEVTNLETILILTKGIFIDGLLYLVSGLLKDQVNNKLLCKDY